MASMFSIITKNFFKKPATRLYPAQVREPFERTRGRLYFDDKDCIYCGICQKSCPADAIKVDRPSSTWELDAYRCIICGECVNKCPKKSLSLTPHRRSVGVERKTVTLVKELPKEVPAKSEAVENKTEAKPEETQE